MTFLDCLNRAAVEFAYAVVVYNDDYRLRGLIEPKVVKSRTYIVKWPAFLLGIAGRKWRVA